jgi:L-alanine-DL-glutamate epimerase-like enolase superfamily enzyme
LVVVEVAAAGKTGLGYTYANVATAHLVRDLLTPIVAGGDPFDVPAVWVAMYQAVRNLGRPGICSMAISAVDVALWDLKARLLGLPLAKLLGMARAEVQAYGSGGFTTYSHAQLQDQLGGWARQGFRSVKMKVGTHPADDYARVKAAREAVGDDVELFVDANGAYARKPALAFAERFTALGVTWFEEPVPADDLEGLRLLRDRGPARIEIAAGEYGYTLPYFRKMLSAGAVDVLQADASRCGGVSGFLKVAALCEAFGLPLSAHCAPALHLHPCCAASVSIRHIEYFHDHARIEGMLFDGVATPSNGALRPDPDRPGLGLDFRRLDAEKFKVWAGEKPL